VKADRDSPSIPNVAATIARGLWLVKLRTKKIGANRPRCVEIFGSEKAYVDFSRSGNELSFGRHTRTRRLVLIDRSTPDRQTDQQNRHRSTGEERKFRIVSAAKRTRDAQTEERNYGTDLPTRRPGRGSRHESIQAKPHDAAHLKQYDQDFKDGAKIRRSTENHTGSFLGSCVGDVEL
jgi:hypothetical protein